MPHHCQGPRKTNGLFRDLLQTLEDAYPAAQYQRISVVVDMYKIYKAKPVDDWLANHPRVTLLFLPTDCLRANPIEAHLSTPKAITATAHKLARLIYTMLKHGTAYVARGMDEYEERSRARVVTHLTRRAQA